MLEKELLEKFLKFQIRMTKKEIRNLPPSHNEKEEYYIELKDKLRKIIENNDELLTLDLETLKIEFPALLEKEIKFLNFCKITQKSKFIELKEYDLGYLRQIFAKINTIINDYLKENTKEKEIYLNKIETLTEMLERIKSSSIEPKDVDTLYELIKDIEIDEAMKLMKAISNIALENRSLISKTEEEEETNLFEEETNLEEEDLIKLFEKYGINFTLFSLNAQNELKTHGVLEKIEEILITFIECGLPLSEHIEEIIINKKTPQLARLFIGSDRNKIIKIFDICKEKNIVIRNDNNEIIYDKEGNSQIDIIELLKFSSMFISRKVKWKKKNPTGIEGPTNDSSQVGRHEDFIENISFFTKLGVDVGKSFKKCGYVFLFSNEHIRLAIKNLELYGITEEEYIKTLSSLSSLNQCDVLDQFIELGYLDYIKNNLSYLAIKQPQSPIFYKLARLNQLSLPAPKGREERNVSTLKLEITQDKKDLIIEKKDGTVEIINSKNGAEITEQYIPTFEKQKEYDKAYTSSLNNTTRISCGSQIIRLLDQNYISPYYDKYSNKTYQTLDSREIEINANHEIVGDYPKHSSIVYNIAGVQISRLKVLRIYDTLLACDLGGNFESIMYAITKNSILTQEQYNAIYEEIKQLLDKKRSLR